MIDEKKLIRVMWDRYNEHYNNANRFSEKETEMAYRVLSDLQLTIENMPRVGEWIPVSEKLPENIKTVLVTIKELEQPILGWYGNKFGWRIVMPEFVNIKDFTVIAWMSLPEPYKEVDDETMA